MPKISIFVFLLELGALGSPLQSLSLNILAFEEEKVISIESLGTMTI